MKFSELIDRFKHAHVLVIGDLMLDHYIWGDVHRISPEAPVPVVNVTNDTYAAGGAANVALNLANLGIQTMVIGHYNNDEAGNQLSKILYENDISLMRPQNLSDAPTIIKTRVIVRNQQLCRIDKESAYDKYRITDSPDLYGMLYDAMKKSSALIISDYAKGTITQGLVDKVLEMAADFPNLLVAIDPKPSRKLAFSNVNLLKPNRAEALQLAGLKEPQSGEQYPIEMVCQRINKIYRPELLIITLGAEGMVISRKGKIITHLPTDARQVFDVSGAGDTVIATLTAALVCGANPVQAARLANAAAGCVVAHVGTAPIALDELMDWAQKTALQATRTSISFTSVLHEK